MKLGLTGLAIAICAGTSYAGPVLLGTWSTGVSLSTPQIVHSARPVLSYSSDDFSFELPLFESFPPPDSYPAMAMETVSSGNDPEFDAFAERLTNGVDDFLLVLAWADGVPIGGGGTMESSNLTRFVPGFGPDLLGYEINYIREVLDVNLETPGSDPWGNGINTDWSVSGVYEFYGTPIPEPGSLLLCAGGLFVHGVAARMSGR